MKRALPLLLVTGCMYTQFVAQAAHGELELLGHARPIEDVVRIRTGERGGNAI